MKQVLTIAGSDSGGGAGIQADLKTFHANGTFGMSAITSVTAQNSREVRKAYDLPIDIIVDQIEAVFDDFDISAVKTGMLSSREIVEAVSDQLVKRKASRIVVDPVMISKSGFSLLNDDAVESITKYLLPIADLVTPNVHEANLLAGMQIEGLDQAKRAARKIFDSGPGAVLVKGGHLADRSGAVDILFDGSEETVVRAERIDTPNTHGTGCTYSAAIAAHLARGKPLVEAVSSAKAYITEAIRHSLSIGKGHGPTHHFYFLAQET